MNAKGYEEYLLLRRAVEELLSEHGKLVELTTGLENELSDVRRQLAAKNEEVKELQARYERAKFSGAILGRRVSELVREIDKCIALLDR